MSLHHYHALGSSLRLHLLLGYIFCQCLLIWVANLPARSYLLRRQDGAGSRLPRRRPLPPPFCVLLARGETAAWKLAAIAAWILFAHWVDACWLVMPFSATPAWSGRTSRPARRRRDRLGPAAAPAARRLPGGRPTSGLGGFGSDQGGWEAMTARSLRETLRSPEGRRDRRRRLTSSSPRRSGPLRSSPPGGPAHPAGEASRPGPRPESGS